MSALVTDLKDLCEREEPVYVGLAVLLAVIVLAVFMDSLLLPVLFLVSIGIAILYNLGTNYFFGEISYIMKALASVLQLGVTMDYSIFLWNRYKEEKQRNGGDREDAIAGTITLVVGSSITTIAGFIALCFMTFTLGRDLGLVMTKGVLFGVLGCVTTLPAMILLSDRTIEKTSHKVLMPDIHGLACGLMKHFKWGLAIFLVLLVPALYGYVKAPLYYDFTGVMPKDMECIIANTKLKDEFDVSSTHMALVDADLSGKEAAAMPDEMEAVDGLRMALGLNSLIGLEIPEEMLPDSLREILKTDCYQLLLISSEYTVSTDEVNEQIDELKGILKAYDPEGMLIGEAPCTKDLIGVTDRDFKVVDAISIVSIFAIIALSFFAATFGVAVYSNIDIIKSLCSLIARRILAAGFAFCMMLSLTGCARSAQAAEPDGEAKKIIVSSWLKNGNRKDVIEDISDLKNIENVKGDETWEEGGEERSGHNPGLL